MKKTLIAIAAIAAMGAASAQVTLYGKLDVGVSSNKDESKSVDQSAQVGSGNYEGSRIGVKGSSDIAGGVKGMFVIEGGLGSTDGSFSSFNRVTKLGLSGGFGAVQAGLDWSPYDNAFNDAMEYNGFSAMSAAFAGGVHSDQGNTGSGNTKNSIQYTTPSFGGLNAVLMYANGGDATAATQASVTGYFDPTTGLPKTKTVAAVPAQSASSYTGIGVNYSAGPLTINFANEAKKPQGDGSTVNAWILAGSYNLGVASVFAAAETADAGTGVGKDTGMAVGVSMPVNTATTVALGFATEKTSLDGVANDGKTNSTGVQVVYAWNAATAIYAGYRKTDTTALGSTTTTAATKFATGVRYNF